MECLQVSWFKPFLQGGVGQDKGMLCDLPDFELPGAVGERVRRGEELGSVNSAFFVPMHFDFLKSDIAAYERKERFECCFFGRKQ